MTITITAFDRSPEQEILIEIHILLKQRPGANRRTRSPPAGAVGFLPARAVPADMSWHAERQSAWP